jgi:acetyltransferase
MIDKHTVHTFKTKDGMSITVRPLRSEDAPLLVDLFEHMGSDSRFLRFNLSLDHLDSTVLWSEARRMAQLKPGDGAWLAFADLPDQPQAPVAGVRFVRLDSETAEAAISVRDDMQNRGVGQGLLVFLLREARAAGLRRLVATVQRINRPLWRLLSKMLSDSFERRSEGGYTHIVVDLSRLPSDSQSPAEG